MSRSLKLPLIWFVLLLVLTEQQADSLARDYLFQTNKNKNTMCPSLFQPTLDET